MYSNSAKVISLRLAKHVSCKFTDIDSHMSVQAELLQVDHEIRHMWLTSTHQNVTNCTDVSPCKSTDQVTKL